MTSINNCTPNIIIFITVSILDFIKYIEVPKNQSRYSVDIVRKYMIF